MRGPSRLERGLRRAALADELWPDRSVGVPHGRDARRRGGRFGYTHASPYAYWFIDLAWLPWLEMNVRLSTFDNVWVAPSGAINNTGNGRDYMDKAIDLKAMLWR